MWKKKSRSKSNNLQKIKQKNPKSRLNKKIAIFSK